jgi:hypothetical protein
MTLACVSGCGSADPAAAAPSWQVVHQSLPGALLSVWGSSAHDVWTAGSAPAGGEPPTVLHFDGSSWSALDTGSPGDLWWVFGFASGPVYLGGTGGQILRYVDGTFEAMTTPGTGTVFGIWGTSPDALWAVGGEPGGAQGAFAWRLEQSEWIVAPGFPSDLAKTDALWKVFGHGADDVWMVGTGGKTVHWDGSSLSQSFTGLAESLFTVHANSRRFASVGGFGTGLVLERDIPDYDGNAWVNASPSGAPSIIGVCLTDTGGYAVGEFGFVATRAADGWSEEETGFEDARSLHSVWVDPDGGVWSVGGQVRVPPLAEGLMLHKGARVPGLRAPSVRGADMDDPVTRPSGY